MGSPKALPGDVPTGPALKPHSWQRGDWLNNPYGGGVCSVCGCTMRTEGSVIRADVKYEGTWYLYTDCLGREIRSSVELSCPVFAGEGVSAGLEGKEIGRRAKVAADKVDLRVTQLDARVVQLEADNAALREQLSSVTQIDVRQLAAALMELAAKAKANRALESIEMRGQHVLVPKELVEVIDVVAVREDDEKEG